MDDLCTTSEWSSFERVRLFSLLWSHGEILLFRFSFRDLSSRVARSTSQALT